MDKDKLIRWIILLIVLAMTLIPTITILPLDWGIKVNLIIILFLCIIGLVFYVFLVKEIREEENKKYSKKNRTTVYVATLAIIICNIILMAQAIILITDGTIQAVTVAIVIMTIAVYYSINTIVAER